MPAQAAWSAAVPIKQGSFVAKFCGLDAGTLPAEACPAAASAISETMKAVLVILTPYNGKPRPVAWLRFAS